MLSQLADRSGSRSLNYSLTYCTYPLICLLAYSLPHSLRFIAGWNSSAWSRNRSLRVFALSKASRLRSLNNRCCSPLLHRAAAQQRSAGPGRSLPGKTPPQTKSPRKVQCQFLSAQPSQYVSPSQEPPSRVQLQFPQPSELISLSHEPVQESPAPTPSALNPQPSAVQAHRNQPDTKPNHVSLSLSLCLALPFFHKSAHKPNPTTHHPSPCQTRKKKGRIITPSHDLRAEHAGSAQAHSSFRRAAWQKLVPRDLACE